MNAVIETRYGEVRGSVADGVASFKGIPYAAPPFGANRLQPPRPVQPWSGVRDALSYGPKFPQPQYPPHIATLLPPELGGQGEDCLVLNIWAPATGSDAPVMVWIPGGMYAYHGTGASPWYDGSHFARDGIVCVTINYRVGIDGFLYLGRGNANRGLLDQVAALAWVRDNIGAFGGNPGNVTIFGESAGAMSVGTLLAMPCAAGLFRRAIAQSGAAHHVLSIDSAELVGQRLAERLGVGVSREAIAAVPTRSTAGGPDRIGGRSRRAPRPGTLGSGIAAQHDAVAASDRRGRHPCPTDRSHRGRGRRGRGPDGRHEHRRASIVPGDHGRHRSHHRAGSHRRHCRLRASNRTRARCVPIGTPGRHCRRPARGHPDRLVLARPRHSPGRRACHPRRVHLHVRIRLALAAVRRAPRCVPCARDPVRVRHAAQSHRPAVGNGSTTATRRHHARGLGRRSPRAGVAIGRLTISIAGRPCASAAVPRRWTILDRPSVPYGPASGRACSAAALLSVRWLRHADQDLVRCRARPAAGIGDHADEVRSAGHRR